MLQADGECACVSCRILSVVKKLVAFFLAVCVSLYLTANIDLCFFMFVVNVLFRTTTFIFGLL